MSRTKIIFTSMACTCLWSAGLAADEPGATGDPIAARIAPQLADREIEYDEAPGWAVNSAGKSTLTLQVRAALRAIRERSALAEASEVVPVQTVTVAHIDEPAAEDQRCELMEVPGSRIRETRCYFPNPADEALDRFQLEADKRDINEQLERMQRERAEMESYLNSNPGLMRGPSSQN